MPGLGTRGRLDSTGIGLGNQSAMARGGTLDHPQCSSATNVPHVAHRASATAPSDRGILCGRISRRRVSLIDVGTNVSSDGPHPDGDTTRQFSADQWPVGPKRCLTSSAMRR
jgi:hypothetical protein